VQLSFHIFIWDSGCIFCFSTLRPECARSLHPTSGSSCAKEGDLLWLRSVLVWSLLSENALALGLQCESSDMLSIKMWLTRFLAQKNFYNEGRHCAVKSDFCVYLFLASMEITIMESCSECMCALVCLSVLPFADNFWSFSAQFLLKLVVSNILGPHTFHENKQLHIAEEKPTALYGRQCIPSTQAMLGIKESAEESHIVCPNITKSFSQSWYHQRIPL